MDSVETWVGVDWIGLARGREQCGALLTTFGFHKILEPSSAAGLAACQKVEFHDVSF
jgi:hypothetical protein